MKQIEACAEAARRCGYSEKRVKRFIEKIRMYGAEPEDINKELEPGDQEAFIRQQMEVLNAVRANLENPVFQESMKRLRSKMQARN